MLTQNIKKEFSYENFMDGKTTLCTSCGDNDNFIEDKQAGDIICTSCGIVQIQRKIHDGAYWSNYDSDRQSGKDNSHVGWTDPTNPYSTLGTMINPHFYFECYNKDGELIKKSYASMQQIVNNNSKEKSFYEVIKIFEKLTFESFVNKKIIDKAKIIWNEIFKHGKIYRGGVRKGLLACCVLYSGYDSNCSRTRDQIAQHMLISKDEIIKGEPIFYDIISKTKYAYILKKNLKSNEMFAGIINQLGLPYKFYVKTCNEIYNKCEEELSEISSSAAIGGVVCYVINVLEKKRKPTKKKILQVVGITNPTLTNAVKIIKNKIS
jgi:transcription initiation factor TFIIB